MFRIPKTFWIFASIWKSWFASFEYLKYSNYSRCFWVSWSRFGVEWVPLSINPIWPSQFWCIKDLGLNKFGLGGVRAPILFGNDLPRNNWPFSKGFMKFGCQEPFKKCLTFETLVRQRVVWPVCKGPPLWNFGISDKFYFFSGKRDNFAGVKSVMPFSKLITEKSQVFQQPRTYICTDKRKAK